MSTEKKRNPTKYPGVYYIETTGRDGKPERVFYFYFKKDGKQYEEKAGRQRENAMTAARAARIRAERIEGKRKSRREIREAARNKPLSFGDLFEKRYLPHSVSTKQNPRSSAREESLFRLWISPVIGKKSLYDVAPIHIERVLSNMKKASQSPRSCQYAVAVIRQVFNFARAHGLFHGENPTSKIKKPNAKDNRRTRFLTHQEANALLEELQGRSRNTHDITLLSLHTGMRASEIFSLRWQDVDFGRGIISVRDTKSGRNRAAFMTEDVRKMLSFRVQDDPGALVFPSRSGGKISQVSDSFNRAVEKLGLNDGITDPRQKVVFHTCRHTFASWLVEQGTDLYHVKELLGHQDFKMTARYSHLGPNVLQGAIKRLDRTLEANRSDKTPSTSETQKTGKTQA